MEFMPNYITVDSVFEVSLPVEFTLIFLLPSEVNRHKKQILNTRILARNRKSNRKSYRRLFVDNVTGRVFFTSIINRLSPYNITYYLDELVKINKKI